MNTGKINDIVDMIHDYMNERTIAQDECKSTIKQLEMDLIGEREELARVNKVNADLELEIKKLTKPAIENIKLFLLNN